MIGKILVLLILIVVAIILVGFFYQNLPQPPINLEIDSSESESFDIIEYGHNVISFNIDSGCETDHREAMLRALGIFQDEMEIIRFVEIDSVDTADIKISCPDKRIELGESLFAAGEGGPSEIINTSFFKTIKEGKIYLYESPKCEYPVVELHELLHVFGFDHSDNPRSIMYNTSRCDQRITPDMVELIKNLYSIEPLPELVITEISAVKKGKYLDFNITVTNEGLLAVNNVSLKVYGDDKFAEEVWLGDIEIGYGRPLRAANIKLSSTKVQEVEFIVDEENSIEEFDKENNLVSMTVQSQ